MTTANLSVADNDTVIQYLSGGESVFDVPFPFLAATELRVSVDQVDQVNGSDYTVTGAGQPSGGQVTFASATTAGEKITIWQEMPIERLTGFTTGAAVLTAAALNAELARATRVDQQLRRDIRRSLRLAPDDPQSGQDMEIPTQTERAGKFLAFNASGVPIATTGDGAGDPDLRAELADGTDVAKGYALVAIPTTAQETGAGANVVNAHLDPGDPDRYISSLHADDSTGYEDAEDLGPVELRLGRTYDLGEYLFSEYVHGPGALTFEDDSANSATVDGFQVLHDPRGSSIYSVPDVWAELAKGLAQSPGIGTYFNVALAPGSNILTASGNVWRCVLLGEAVGETITSWERTEAIGQGAMRFAVLSERNTALGSIALQWAGAPDQQHLIDTFHDFWLSDTPGSGTWNFANLETKNPGIGAAIQAFSNYPTLTSQIATNTAISRDALLHLVRGTDNVAVGYQAGAHMFEATENVCVGPRALRDGVFIDSATAIGRSAGIHYQEGLGGIFLGHEAGENYVKGDRCIFLGGSAGQDHNLSGASDFDNKFIMEFFNLGTYLEGDMAVGSLVLGGMGTKDLADLESLGSGFYKIVSLANAPATPGRFLGTATATVSTFNSYAGATAARVHATFENTNGVVGTISTSGSATAYNTSSDQRLKDDHGGIQGALDLVDALPVHVYSWKSDERQVRRHGFFSQEAQKVLPWTVTGEPDGMEEIGCIYDSKGKRKVRCDVPDPGPDIAGTWQKTGERVKPQQLAHEQLVPTLWAAVQELRAELEGLRGRLRPA